MAKADETGRARNSRPGATSGALPGRDPHVHPAARSSPASPPCRFTGHTPGHSGYMIASGKDCLLIWGDIVHVPEIQIPATGSDHRLRHRPGAGRGHAQAGLRHGGDRPARRWPGCTCISRLPAPGPPRRGLRHGERRLVPGDVAPGGVDRRLERRGRGRMCPDPLAVRGEAWQVAGKSNQWRRWACSHPAGRSRSRRRRPGISGTARKAGELRLQRCNACRQGYFPPRPFCPHARQPRRRRCSRPAARAALSLCHQPPARARLHAALRDRRRRSSTRARA